MPKLSSEEKPVLIVSPDFPPRKGGVSDHTYFLALNLCDKYNVRVLTSKDCLEVDEFQVHPSVADWHDIDELYNTILYLSKKCRVIWQYVPHMYGRGGVNKAVPEVVEMLAETRTRQMMIAHEIFAPMNWAPNRALYAMSQRSQWKKMTRHMERIGVSSQAWIDQGWGMNSRNEDAYEFCPSPSAVPVVDVEKKHAENWKVDHGLSATTKLIGFFGDPGPGKQFDWVIDTWIDAQDNSFEVALVCIGREPDYQPDSVLSPLFIPTGYIAKEDVSRALQAIDVMALPFESGVSEKRSSFAAALQHGCPIVTVQGENTSEQLQNSEAFWGVESESSDDFSDHVIKLLKDEKSQKILTEKAKKYYESHLSWDFVTQKVDYWIKNPQKVR